VAITLSKGNRTPACDTRSWHLTSRLKPTGPKPVRRGASLRFRTAGASSASKQASSQEVGLQDKVPGTDGFLVSNGPSRAPRSSTFSWSNRQVLKFYSGFNLIQAYQTSDSFTSSPVLRRRRPKRLASQEVHDVDGITDRHCHFSLLSPVPKP